MGNCCDNNFKDYKSFESLSNALRTCGVLEDLEIVVGVDMTRSNEMNGRHTFAGHSLHDTTYRENPYQCVMRTSTMFLERDMDAVFPLYFFGSEQANAVGGALLVKECRGQRDLLETYAAESVRQRLSGPTSFVPLINETIRRIKISKKYHILLIITDGAVSEEREHYPCLNEASHFPLSVVCVGVGDGPFDIMERFDDKIPKGRLFDNFQFVDFSSIVKKESQTEMEKEFFFRAFMEVPEQYNACKRLLGYSSSLAVRGAPVQPAMVVPVVQQYAPPPTYYQAPPPEAPRV